MRILDILCLLTPEIALSALALGVLLVDLLFIRKESVERRHEILGWTIQAGLVMVGVVYFAQFRLWHDAVIVGNGAFVASPLNSIFKLLIIGLTMVTVMIGIKTPYSAHVGEYYSLLIFAVLGMVFLVSSEDLLMIFVALELISLSLYVLTAFQKGAKRSVEAGLKYFLFGGLSAAFLLFGLSYLYGATGHTALREIAAALTPQNRGRIPMGMLNIGILFTLVGLGFKIAAVPFHLWAPDAYEGAPTPVAAMIATGSKVASFVVLTKLMLEGLPGVAGTALFPNWESGWTVTVAAISVASLLLGNLAAIAQTNVKRLLAYSSVAHAGAILVAIVAVSSSGAPSAMAAPAIYFYITIYALTNVGAFGVVNAVAAKAGGDDFAHFAGMARRAPYLSLLMLIFLLSLAGIPPLAGFFGKFYLFAAAIQADPQHLGLLWLVALAVLMSAVSLYYYLKLTKQMYVLPATDPRRVASPPWTRVTLGGVCLVVVLLGVFPSRLMGVFQRLQGGPGASRPAEMTVLQSRPLPPSCRPSGPHFLGGNGSPGRCP